MTTPLDAALEYLARGWSVVPAHTATTRGCSCLNESCEAIGKHPRVKWKPYQDRLPAESDVRTWWRRWPEANVAILTGAVSGIVVVDIDPRHGGDDSIRDIPNLPETLTATTGGGGEHRYWRHPGYPVPNAAGIRPGIDVRGDGGYVLAPPSTHKSGGVYAWDAGQPDEPREMPAGLRAELTGTRPIGDAPPSSRGFDPEQSLIAPIGEGERNERLAQIAGHYASTGMPYHALGDALLGANSRLCRPPLDADEVAKIVESIWTRERRKHAIEDAVTERLNGHNGDATDVVDPDDRRAMARQVWAEIGVAGVVDWLLVRTVEANEYVLTTTEDEVRLGPHILDQRSILNALADNIAVMLPLTKVDAWLKRAKLLRDLVREQSVDLPHSRDRVDEWVEAFVAAKPADTPVPEGRGRSLRSRATMVDGVLYLRPVVLMRYMESEGEPTKIDQVRRLLRRGGWEPRNIRAGDRVIKAWAKS